MTGNLTKRKVDIANLALYRHFYDKLINGLIWLLFTIFSFHRFCQSLVITLWIICITHSKVFTVVVIITTMSSVRFVWQYYNIALYMIKQEIIVEYIYENSLKYSGVKCHIEQFSIECRRNSELPWTCFTIPFDWSKNFAPSSRPIRCKTKTNRDLATRVFPRFRSVTWNYYEF